MTKPTETPAADTGDLQPMAASEVGVTVQRDPERIARLMAERMDRAETLDEMFAVTAGSTSDDLIGKTFELLAVEWDAYEADQGVIPLAIVTAIDKSTGDKVEWATTAGMLTRFLRRAEVTGNIPFTARVEGRKTRSGQTALNFVKP